MRVRYHPDASAEVAATALYIEGHREGWGARFIDAVEAAVRRIADDPEFPPVVRRKRRDTFGAGA